MPDITLQNVQNIFFGNHQIDKVFLGDRQVRPEETPPTPVVPTNGLLGYRKLESDLLDTSGNGYNADWYDNSGTKNFVTVGGKTGAYVYLRRTSQHIVTPLNNVGVGVSEFSIGGWVCFESISQGVRVGPATNNANDGTFQTDGISIYLSNDYLNRIDTLIDDVDGTSLVVSSNIVPTLLSWYFICLTFGDGKFGLYVDGTLEREMYGPWFDLKAGDVWRLGCGGENRGVPDYGGMNGYIRDWAVYDRELSPQEVSDFYNATL